MVGEQRPAASGGGILAVLIVTAGIGLVAGCSKPQLAPVLKPDGLPRFEDAVTSLVDDVFSTARLGRGLSLRPAYRGVPAAGGGGAFGFFQLVRRPILDRGCLATDQAPLHLEVGIETAAADHEPARLVATLTGPGQPADGLRVTGAMPLDDAAELARWAGVTVDLPRRPRAGQIDAFRQALHSDVIHLAADGRRLQESSQGRFGLAVGLLPAGAGPEAASALEVARLSVAGVPRGGVVQIPSGRRFEVEVLNAEPYDVAVDLTVDGIDASRALPGNASGNSAGRWLFVPAGASAGHRGWADDASAEGLGAESGDLSPFGRQLVAGASDGAAAPAVGLITATVHACWRPGTPPPADEPILRDGQALRYSVIHYRMEERNVTLADGTGVQGEVLVPETHFDEQQAGSPHGESFVVADDGVARVIGVPRAVLALRYMAAP